MKNLLLFCLYLSFITSSLAQWKDVQPPRGYDFQSSFIDQSGNIFIGVYDDIYYSDDRGYSWTKTGYPDFKYTLYGLDKLIEMENHDILFNINNNVYKFNRNTKAWDLYLKAKYSIRDIDHHGYVWCDNVDPSNSQILVTKDKGITYEAIANYDPQIQCHGVKIDTYQDSIHIMMTDCDGHRDLYRFSDNGNFVLLSDLGTESFLFINQNTGTLFVYNKNFELCRSSVTGSGLVPVSLPPNTWSISSPFIQLLNNGTLLLRDGYDFYFSEDDGISWQNFTDKLSPDALASFYPSSIAFINSSDSVIAISNDCGHQGTYISADKGITWENINDNLFEPSIFYIYGDSKGSVYLNTCSDSTLLMSHDDGLSWNQYMINCNGKDYAVIARAENENGEIFAISIDKVFKSSDNGVSFTTVEIPSNLFFNWSFRSIEISEAGIIYLMDSQEILVSKDNGITWKVINTSQYTGLSIPFIDNNDDIYVISSNTLLRCAADKNSFEVVAPNFEFDYSRFLITKSGMIYFRAADKIAGNIAYWISKDGLKTYEKLENIPYISRRLFSDDYSNVYIETYDSIFISTDQGQSISFICKRPDSNVEYYVSPTQYVYAIEHISASIFKYANKLSSRAIVTGHVYNDINKDCDFDIIELGKSLNIVRGQGVNDAIAYSLTDGRYILRLQNGSYSVSAVEPNILWQACPPSIVNINSSQQDSTYLDLGLSPKDFCPYLDVQVQTPSMRRCFDNNIYIRYTNEGTSSSLNTKLVVHLFDKLVYISSSVPPSSQNGQELVFDLGELASGASGTIIIKAHLDCNADQGESICVSADLKTDSQCSISLANHSSGEKCTPATGSFDPNEKLAYINGKLSTGQAEKNQNIEYLIRFQNTGTDTAFRVVIEDQIPVGFDLNSFKPLNSSHPYTIEIEGQRTVKFIFDPIMLPDSNINEPASHGFIAFRISPKANLDYGAKLDNYADIYFDFNKPVRTNTSLLTLAKTTSNFSIDNGIDFNYFPNPTRGELYFTVGGDNNALYTIKVNDILGKEIIRENIQGKEFVLRPKQVLLPGLYFIELINEKGNHGLGKFIVE